MHICETFPPRARKGRVHIPKGKLFLDVKPRSESPLPKPVARSARHGPYAAPRPHGPGRASCAVGDVHVERRAIDHVHTVERLTGPLVDNDMMVCTAGPLPRAPTGRVFPISGYAEGRRVAIEGAKDQGPRTKGS